MIETDPQPPEAPGNPPPEKAHPEEVRFLAGPQSRLAEFFRILRIAWEFFRGFRTLHFVGPCVTVFGSARVDGDDRYYALAREMGVELAHSGFTVITGGGPGVMEAANRGAKEAGGRSVGVNIVLPHEQVTNKYLDVVLTFRYFFVRKVMLVKYSYAFIVMPGGFGTMDELFEAATLVQTDKIQDFPIILMGSEYWAPLSAFIHERMLVRGTIAPEDSNILYITDDPDEAATIVREFAQRSGAFERQPRRLWFLAER